MGNSDNTPNDGKLSLDTSAPLWSAILREVSKGKPIADFSAPRGLERATVDVFTGLRPGPFTTKTINELFVPGTVPRQRETLRMAATVDAATGLLWQDGCAGPKVTRGFFNLNEYDQNYPAWQRADANWASRAAGGPGVAGGPKGTRTSYFYSNAFAPFGRTWGAPFMPRSRCPIYVPPKVCDPFASPAPGDRACIRIPVATTQPNASAKPTPKPTMFKIRLVTPKPTKKH
jgi:hypothetical protein